MKLSPKFFTVEKDGPVVIWKYNNPPSNLRTMESDAEYVQLISEFEADPELRAGIFTSALPDVFIQHYDVATLVKWSELIKAAPENKITLPDPPTYRTGPKVIIAAINASLAGGGLELVMECDFRFMSRTAYAAQPEVIVGILASGGGTQRMPRLIGLDKALDLQLTGRPISADEAFRIGLVTRVSEPDKLLPDAIAFAKIIASRPPLAVANIRKAMYEGLNMSLKEGLKLEWQLQMQLFASDDAQRLMKQYVAGGQNAELMRRELPPI